MSTFGDALGTVGDVLDAPRSALWSHVISPLAGREMQGGSDLLSALGADPEHWLTQAGGMALDVASDPLTWAGMGLGSRAAGAAFRRMGPRYGADAAKLSGLAIPAADAERGGAMLAREVLGSSSARDVLHEIPAGSRYLGSGAESLNLRTPAGDVLKIAEHNPRAAIAVPEAEGVIQPTRRVVHGPYEVNRVPHAERVGDAGLFEREAGPLRDRLGRQGVDVYDLKPEDLGLVNGRPTIVDMGSVDALSPSPFRPVYGRTPRSHALAGMGMGASPAAISRGLLGDGGAV